MNSCAYPKVALEVGEQEYLEQTLINYTSAFSARSSAQQVSVALVKVWCRLKNTQQEKPTNCGTKAADVLANILAGQL